MSLEPSAIKNELKIISSKTLKHWLPVIIWAAIIFFFSANTDPYTILPESWRALRPFPQVSDSSLTEFIGVIMHILEYATLAYLLFRAIHHDKIITSKSILTIILLTLLYAVTDEIHQFFVPGRTFQLFDLFIDSLGAIIGSFVFKRIFEKLEH